MAREYLFAAATLLVCLFIAGVSLCRLRLTTVKVRLGVRIKYAALGAGALAFGFGPWAGEARGWPGLVFALAVAVGLATSSARWRDKPPPETNTDHAPLEGKP